MATEGKVLTERASTEKSMQWKLLVITRNSSGDEIANVNFLCDDIVHALKIQ